MEVFVKSERGFYIGDICYVLGDGIYHGVWGANGYKDGEVEVPHTGLSFGVAGTAYGDGSYCDGEGNIYGVDAGVIGIVPLELIGKMDGLENGRVVFGSGIATFVAVDGVFDIEFPDGELVHINTRDWDDDEEDEWEDEEDYDDDDFEDDWGDGEDEFQPEPSDFEEMGYDPYLGCYTGDV